MNRIRYTMLTVTLLASTTASLDAMKKSKMFISDHSIVMDEEYKDLSECVKSKKPMSLVQYVAKYNVSHQELSECLNDAVLTLNDITEFLSGKTVLHCAVADGKYPKAIPTLLMAEDKQEAYQLACMKDSFGWTALHYAVQIEDVDVAEGIIIAILQTASTRDQACHLMNIKNTRDKSVLELQKENYKSRIYKVLIAFQINDPGSKGLQEALKKESGTKKQQGGNGSEFYEDCECTLF